MNSPNLKKLLAVVNGSSSLQKRIKAVRIILEYYSSNISSQVLFSFIPYMFVQEDVTPNINIRRKIESEIRARKNDDTFNRLLGLLYSKDENLKFVGCELLSEYNKPEVIEPVFEIIRSKELDWNMLHAAVFALRHIPSEKVDNELLRIYKNYKPYKSEWVVSDILWKLEVIINERGIDILKI